MTNDARLAGPLAGLRVLELADEKGQYCGKLMADLGADLIKIEPPGGQVPKRALQVVQVSGRGISTPADDRPAQPKNYGGVVGN